MPPRRCLPCPLLLCATLRARASARCAAHTCSLPVPPRFFLWGPDRSFRFDDAALRNARAGMATFRTSGWAGGASPRPLPTALPRAHAVLLRLYLCTHYSFQHARAHTFFARTPPFATRALRALRVPLAHTFTRVPAAFHTPRATPRLQTRRAIYGSTRSRRAAHTRTRPLRDTTPHTHAFLPRCPGAHCSRLPRVAHARLHTLHVTPTHHLPHTTLPRTFACGTHFTRTHLPLPRCRLRGGDAPYGILESVLVLLCYGCTAGCVFCLLTPMPPHSVIGFWTALQPSINTGIATSQPFKQ